MDESLRIEHLEWDDWNLDHIQKHGITQSDAESVVWGASIAERTYKNRWLILGSRGDGRILALVVGEVSNRPAGSTRFLLGRRVAKNDGCMRNARAKEILMGKTEARPRQTVPEFKSIQEEAEFWDTHDFTDFTDFSKSGRITVSPNLTSVLTIRIDGDDFDQLVERAQELGTGASTLARMWIRERLRQEAGDAAE